MKLTVTSLTHLKSSGN